MLYEKIKELCKQKGIAITALEKELKFGRGSIGKLQHGGTTSDARIRAIADYFGVTTDYLMGREETNYYIDPETAELAQELFDNPDMRVLFDAARDSRPEDLRMVADMLKRFKETNHDA